MVRDGSPSWNMGRRGRVFRDHLVALWIVLSWRAFPLWESQVQGRIGEYSRGYWCIYIYSLVRWFRDRKSGIIEILLGDCYRKCLRLCIGDWERRKVSFFLTNLFFHYFLVRDYFIWRLKGLNNRKISYLNYIYNSFIVKLITMQFNIHISYPFLWRINRILLK